MIVLTVRRSYKCVWDGELLHVLLIDGGMLRIWETVVPDG